MVASYNLGIEMLSILLGLSIIASSLRARIFTRYILLNLYLAANVAFSLGCYYTRAHYGYDSYQYYYFYYTGDVIPNILAYILIGWFFDRLLRGSAFHKYVRPTLFFAFLLVVAISARFLSVNVENFYSDFVFEFEQNVYFVGVLLTLLLWISMAYLHAESRRFALLVSGLGIYFSSHAMSYALRFLSPDLDFLAVKIIPLAYNLMLVVWFYSFTRVSEREAAGAREPAPRARSGDAPSPSRV